MGNTKKFINGSSRIIFLNKLLGYFKVCLIFNQSVAFKTHFCSLIQTFLYDSSTSIKCDIFSLVPSIMNDNLKQRAVPFKYPKTFNTTNYLHWKNESHGDIIGLTKKLPYHWKG